MNTPSLEEFVFKAMAKAYGFVMLAIRDAILHGKLLQGETGKALDVLMVLACHVHARNGRRPGKYRLMVLTQMAAESVRKHIQHLESIEMLDASGNVRDCVLQKRSKASKDVIFFPKRWVHLGLWASLTHYDRMVLLYLLANSFPGPTPGNRSAKTPAEYRAYALSEDGARCLLWPALEPTKMATVIGCGTTSIREAIGRLQDRGILELDFDNRRAYLYNSPQKIGTSALGRVYEQKIDPNYGLSAASKRQLAMRKKGARKPPQEDASAGCAPIPEGGESPCEREAGS